MRGGAPWLFDSVPPLPPLPRWAAALPFVILTGAKAQGRDLQFRLMAKRNLEAIQPWRFAVPEGETAGPSPTLSLRSG
jgi:hypothetical protein